MKMMNIYALENHLVRCSNLEQGYDDDKEIAKKYLEEDKIYTVEYTNVDSWETTVFLKEFPNVGFNSIYFIDQIEQCKSDDKKHPDYFKYN